MKTIIILLVSFFNLTVLTLGQNDTIPSNILNEKYERDKLLSQSLLLPELETINQLDSAGKKDGKWVEYLDKKWKILPDSNHAVYYRYEYYDHGKKILLTMSDKANKKMVFTGDTTSTMKPIQLNGEYKWYDRKGRLLTDEEYKNGEHVWFKGYTWGIFDKKLTGKKLHEYNDFTKKYNGQPNTSYAEIYDKKGNIKSYYLRKGKEGWCFYEE